MSAIKKRKYENCTLCKKQVTCSPRVETASGAGDTQLLKRIKEIHRDAIDDTKLSTFVMCNACRDDADFAYEFVQKCHGLLTAQPLAYTKHLENATTQTEWPQETIIIVNQMSDEVEEKQLEDIFSKYGKIVNLYFRKNALFGFDNENFAHITFSNEYAALKVMKAAQNEELYYHDEPLVVTRVSEDQSPIAILPDLCLREVFLRLHDVEDKVNIGKVCKQWKEILARSWNNIDSFTDSSGLEEMKSVGGLRSILKGCGRFLMNLKLSIPDAPIARLQLISKYCQNIKNLQLEPTWEEKTGSYQHELLSVFQQCRKLRRLFFQSDEEFDYNILQHLPTEMLELHLASWDMNTRTSIDLSKFKKLEALLLWSFNIHEDALKGFETLMNLKYLSFNGSRVHSSYIRKILHFKRVKHLSIPECGIDDETLSQIVQRNPDLEYLDISDNPGITDSSFQYVSRLSKLNTLYMKNLTRVRGRELLNMHTVKFLDVEGCISITDWTLILMIDKFPKLFQLYASGVATWRLLMNAEESIKMGHSPFLSIRTDTYLAQKWKKSGKSRGKLWVGGEPRSPLVRPDDWDGWYGDNALES